MFHLTGFSERAHYPHGQMIHVEFNNRCDEWVVVDFEKAINVGRFGSILMNWPTNSRSTNVHWGWECPNG